MAIAAGGPGVAGGDLLAHKQVAPLFGVSKSAADRILDHLAPLLAISPARRPRKDTVYIVVHGQAHMAGRVQDDLPVHFAAHLAVL